MHSHRHNHQSDQGKHKLDELLRPGLHKDWRTWVVVGLMLAAIGIYVFTLDDSVRPGSPQQDIPAAATPR